MARDAWQLRPTSGIDQARQYPTTNSDTQNPLDCWVQHGHSQHLVLHQCPPFSQAHVLRQRTRQLGHRHAPWGHSLLKGEPCHKKSHHRNLAERAGDELHTAELGLAGLKDSSLDLQLSASTLSTDDTPQLVVALHLAEDVSLFTAFAPATSTPTLPNRNPTPPRHTKPANTFLPSLSRLQGIQAYRDGSTTSREPSCRSRHLKKCCRMMGCCKQRTCDVVNNALWIMPMQ